jgi:hypothetical protein
MLAVVERQMTEDERRAAQAMIARS